MKNVRKKFLKITSLFVAVIISATMIPSLALPSEAQGPVAYSQWKGRDTCYGWGDWTYGGGSIHDTGCGILSTANAVNYMCGLGDTTSVGTFIDRLATWAHNRGAFNPGSSDDGTYRLDLYPYIDEFAETYGYPFHVTEGSIWGGVSSSSLINHLKAGGTAVAHVQGHFIAIVAYDESDNTYLVLDSAANASRNDYYDGVKWFTKSELSGSNSWMNVDWFCLLEADDVAPYESGNDLMLADCDTTKPWKTYFGTKTGIDDPDARGLVSLWMKNDDGCRGNNASVGSMIRLNYTGDNYADVSEYDYIKFSMWCGLDYASSDRTEDYFQLNFCTEGEDGFNLVIPAQQLHYGWNNDFHIAKADIAKAVPTADWSKITAIRCTWFNVSDGDGVEFNIDNIVATNDEPTPDIKHQIFDYLTKVMKLNAAASCGVMANIERESGFETDCFGDYAEDGTPTSYGLCQWHNTRYEMLLGFCDEYGFARNSVEGQLGFLYAELQTGYPAVLEYLRSVENTAQGAYDAAWYWCCNFEIPAYKEDRAAERGASARDVYWIEYGAGIASPGTSASPEDFVISDCTSTTGWNCWTGDAMSHIGNMSSDDKTGCLFFVNAGGVGMYYAFDTAMDFSNVTSISFDLALDPATLVDDCSDVYVAFSSKDFDNTNSADWVTGARRIDVTPLTSATFTTSTFKTITLSFDSGSSDKDFDVTSVKKMAIVIAQCANSEQHLECLDNVTASVAKPHSHAYTQKVATAEHLKSSATCTNAAVYYYSCSCGENGTSTFTQGSALGHDFNDWANCSATQHKHVCSRCGISETKSHAWDGGKTTKYPTTTSTGVKTYTCTACGGTKTETIAKLENVPTEAPTEKPTESGNAATMRVSKNTYVITDPATQKIQVTISLENAEPFNNFKIDNVSYNTEYLEFVRAKYLIDGDTRLWNNMKGVFVGSDGDEDFNGDILTLTFAVKSGVTDYEYSYPVSCNMTAETEDGTPVSINAVAGCITIRKTAERTGDANGDGFVDTEDAVAVLYYAIYPEYYEVFDNVDYTNDGDVTAADAIYLLYHVFYPTIYPINAVIPEAPTEPVTEAPTEASGAASFTVSGAIGDDMVIQRDQPFTVWGWAPASENGKKVTATMGGKTASGIISNGEWSVTLPAFDASTTAKTLTLRGNANVTKTYSGILVGDVYFIMGQSNVHYQVSEINAHSGVIDGKEVTVSNNDNIRLNRNDFTNVDYDLTKMHAVNTTSVSKDTNSSTGWQKPSDGAAGFSAIGYYFAKQISEATSNAIPVGVVEFQANGHQLSAFFPNDFAESLNADTKVGADTFDKVCGSPYASRFVYNKYIYAYNNLKIAGILWYQGETDSMFTTLADSYATRFNALMTRFRADHGQTAAEVPVFVVEYPSIYTAIDLGAARVQVGKIAYTLENAYVAASLDLWTNKTYANMPGVWAGQNGQLHPYCKYKQATRLADLALAVKYSKGTLANVAGPVVDGVVIDGQIASINFKYTANGLKTCSGETKYNMPSVNGFEALVNGTWEPVDACISGANSVSILASGNIDAIRYGRAYDAAYGTNYSLASSTYIPAVAFVYYK